MKQLKCEDFQQVLMRCPISFLHSKRVPQILPVYVKFQVNYFKAIVKNHLLELLAGYRTHWKNCFHLYPTLFLKWDPLPDTFKY